METGTVSGVSKMTNSEIPIQGFGGLYSSSQPRGKNMKRVEAIAAWTGLALAIWGVGAGEEAACAKGGKAMQLTSPDFEKGGAIPRKHTCQGGDVAPALAWSGAPEGTKSFALIVDDPDAPDPRAPKMIWVHEVLYNIPATANALPEGRTRKALPDGAREGLNDWKEKGYKGPCPPVGRHRYFFKLHALDNVLPDLGSPTKAQLEKAMQGHVLDKAEWMGTYQKS
jgi:Raf kinase inhibitor-like YbhB/YbcL family protein